MDDSQTHSTLNMFKDANDIKSNLILTTLSFLDYYRPALAFFENVPGFLNYSLNAIQVDRHRVEGGLEMGGLKLLVKALIDMGFVADVIFSYPRLITRFGIQLSSPLRSPSSGSLRSSTKTCTVFPHCSRRRSGATRTAATNP
jgi:hypothetical protein